MFAFVIIALLILIAVGVLLMTEGGKAILLSIGWLAMIGIVLFVMFWLVVFGYSFFHSPAVAEQMSALGSGVGLIFLLLGFIAFVWLAIKFFRDLFMERPKIFTWKERHEMRIRLGQFSVKHSGMIGGLIFLWIVSLMFLGSLPDPWQTPAAAILGWPLLLVFIFLVVVIALGRSKTHHPASAAEKQHR
jgi:hypothetical protein